jgi:competence protein ComEA
MLSSSLSRLLTTKEQYVLIGVASAIVVGCVAVVLTRGPDSAVEAETDPLSAEAAAADISPANAEPVAPEPAPVDAALEVPETSAPKPPTGPVAVAISGAVQSPGVYTLAGGDRVQDLIDAAGGLLAEADASDINMAAPLLDGSTLTVPAGAYSSAEGGRLVMKGAPKQFVTNPPEYTISGWTQRQPVAGNGPKDAQSADTPARSDSAASGKININTASQEELETLPGIGAVKAQEIINYRSQQPFGSVEDLDDVHGIGPKTLENLRPYVTVDPS